LVGSYTVSNFSATSDGHGGTLITDPPAPPIAMMTVSSGQTQTISQGQSDTGDIILSGGTETVVAGGISRNPILDGGLLFDSGFVGRAQVSAGGTLFDDTIANHTTVSSGGVMYIDPTGKARRSVIDNGGTVYDGGAMNRTIVNSGGVLYVGGPVTVSGVTSFAVPSCGHSRRPSRHEARRRPIRPDALHPAVRESRYGPDGSHGDRRVYAAIEDFDAERDRDRQSAATHVR